MANKKPSKESAIAQLWELGELSWKLKGKQKDVYNAIREDINDVLGILISRRFGKSFINCLLAVETCLKTEGCIVKYACPQQRMVKTIIKPIMREILKDCPENLKPIWFEADKVYRFEHNNSEIQVAGTDNGNAENLRGGYSNLGIIDEAGFCSDLDYVINSILLPTTDTTNGRLILTSTPNYKDPQHEFHESFVFPLEAEGRLIKYTIDDSPMVTPEKIKKIEDRYVGGRNNPKFRCEYLCEIPRSSELTVVPEFQRDTKKNMIITELHKPPFFDPYVSMDVGFKDLTVGLFAYYDFKKAELVIVDELVMNGPEMTTDYLAENIREVEKLRFRDENFSEHIPTFLRVMDNDLKLINDLSRLHDLQFVATAKDNKEAAINNLRMWVQNGRIKIHERCKHLIYHLENAQWDKNRKKFKHLKDSPSGDIRGGHADACFHPEMHVITKSGVKHIKDIVPGDLVLTHNNRFKKVLNVMNKEYKGELYKIKPKGRESILCTPEHRFWSSGAFKTRQGSFTGQLMDGEQGWKEAENLNTNRFLYDSYNSDNTKEILKSKAECFVEGYYLAEGNLSGNKTTIQLSGNKKEYKVQKIIQEFVNEIKNDHPNKTFHRKDRTQKWYKANLNVKHNTQKIDFSYKEKWDYLKKLGKSITKRFDESIYDLNEMQTIYFLAGYLFGDGCFQSSGISYNTISPSIAYGINRLLIRLGINSNVYLNKRSKQMVINGVVCNQKDIYECQIPLHQSQALMECFNNFDDLRDLFTCKNVKIDLSKKTQISHYSNDARRIMDIEQINYEGLVYNMEVEDDNSYNINGVSVKNCDALIYLVRNIVESKNPFPSGYGMLSGPNVVDTGWKKKDSSGTIKTFFDSILNKKR